MKRLLFVINDAHFFNTSRLPVALAAKKHGFEVHVACPEDEAAQVIKENGLEFHELPLSRSGKNPLFEIWLIWSLFKLFLRVKPNIVHNVSIKPVLYGGVVARLVRVPACVFAVSGLGTVFLDKGTNATILRLLVLLLYRASYGHKKKVIIFQNSSDCDFFIQKNICSMEDAVILHGSGIDIEKFTGTPEPDLPPRILFVARLLKDKGILEYAEAARLLREKGVEAEFLVAGDIDPANSSSLTAVERDSICEESGLKLLGTRTDMEEIYRESHVVTLPSYREGLPRVLCEAAACERPSITSDVPGCRDAILPGKTGLLVPVRDAVALSFAIEDLIKDPVKRRNFGAAGRRFAVERFDVRVIVEQHMLVYKSLLGLQSH